MSHLDLSRQFHVYGLGNALVDTAIETPDAVLQQLNIDKGVMTLIDEQTACDIALALHDYHHVRAGGGSAANTMFALAQFGGRGFYSCRVADDKDGTFFLQSLQQAGIDTQLTHDSLVTGTATGRCFVLVTPDAQRTMATHLGATAELSRTELDPQAICNAQYLYIEGYLAAQTNACAAAIEAYHIAKDHQVAIALTLSDPNMVTHCKTNLVKMIGDGVDLLFCNEQEALLFTQTTDLNDACDALKHTATQFAITLGGNGALIYDGNTCEHVPGYTVKPIDTVGAGDMFAGAFLYGITHQQPLTIAADIANYAASCIVTKVGPRLTTEEANAVLQKTRSLMTNRSECEK